MHFTKKANEVFVELAGDLGVPPTATKTETFDRWQWFDWAIFVIVAVGVSVFDAQTGTDFGVGLVLMFGLGVAVGALYNVTLRRLWARMYPDLYRRWRCGYCSAVVSQESAECPRCGVRLSDSQLRSR